VSNSLVAAAGPALNEVERAAPEVPRVTIFPGGMLIFVQQTGVVKRLFIGVRLPAVAAAAGDNHQQRITQILPREWGFYGIPAGQFRVCSGRWQARGAGGQGHRM
jgi:hypothetical protein